MNKRCFAMRKGNDGKVVCTCLIGETCNGYEGCAFYKPVRMQKKDAGTAFERLRSLPKEQQRMISEKYYDGEMPWMRKAI